MKVVLICEAPLCVNSGGIGQTLYNIFSFCKPENILCVAPDYEVAQYPPSELFSNSYITYKFRIINIGANRLAKYFGGLFGWLNLSINQFRRFKKLKEKIKAFNADAIVSCPNGVVGVLMHQKLCANINVKVYPYFMDDWMYLAKNKWLGGSLHGNIQLMLSEHKNWLMISNELSDLLSERYKIQPNNVLPIRNPVNINNAPAERVPVATNKFQLAYAGAIWDMHLDALLLIAEACEILSNQGIHLSFTFFTPEHFWNWRKSDFEKFNVHYGGNISYNKIHEVLTEYDALILVSSFSKELFTHSKASVQTKITDYFKSRQLIISCGPEYSANHHFLKKYDCGVCIETNKINEVVTQLKQTLLSLSQLRYKVNNGWQLLQTEFNQTIVQQKLQKFLASA
ncbi:MAG: hypothetical protein JSR09_06135 [Bacteroidetes bacterium]|nr:hypothetical protein [Bacteroidota bacterium]MBS1649268.1 hypothetical protein [Bacteroidota bacterium]